MNSVLADKETQRAFVRSVPLVRDYAALVPDFRTPDSYFVCQPVTNPHTHTHAPPRTTPRAHTPRRHSCSQAAPLSGGVALACYTAAGGGECALQRAFGAARWRCSFVGDWVALADTQAQVLPAARARPRHNRPRLLARAHTHTPHTPSLAVCAVAGSRVPDGNGPVCRADNRDQGVQRIV